jgi:hypothetical protein
VISTRDATRQTAPPNRGSRRPALTRHRERVAPRRGPDPAPPAGSALPAEGEGFEPASDREGPQRFSRPFSGSHSSCRSGTHIRSSKPAGRGSPSLGWFDSIAAPWREMPAERFVARGRRGACPTGRGGRLPETALCRGVGPPQNHRMAAPSVSGRRIQRGTNHGPGGSPPLRMAMANWGPLVWEVGQYERLTGAVWR